MKKVLAVALILSLVLCSVCLLASCSGTDSDNTYYEIKGGAIDESSWIKIGGGKWEDDSGESGTYELKGDTITFSQDGEEIMSATLKDGVLTVSVMGMTVGAYYTKSAFAKIGGKANDPSGTGIVSQEEDENAKVKSITGGSVDGMTISLEVGETIDFVDLSGLLTVSKNSSWQLYEDVTGQKLIPTKYAASLVPGDNFFYVVVNSADDKVNRTYTLNIWKNYYVTVYYNVLGKTYETEKALTHSTLSDHAAPNVPGYTFNGWNCAGTYVEEDDLIFTASLTANTYTVTLDPDDGVLSEEQTTAQATYDASLRLPVPTREGYAFDGWYIGNTEVAGANGAVAKWEYAENKTLKAKWIPNKYTVDASVNNLLAGTVSGAGSYDCGSYATLIATTKAGYTWLGWYDGNEKVSEGDSLEYTITVPAEDKTYTAKWCKVTLANDTADCGSIGSLTDRYLVGDQATVSVTTNIGYTWLGWYDGDTKVSLDNSHSYSFTIPAEDKTYTAKWATADEMKAFTFTSTTTSCEIRGVKDTSITSVIIPGYVTSIGASAFSGCGGMSSVTIPVSVTSIGSKAFDGCSGLTSITIPSGATSIGSGAFRGCSGLTSVTIPASVTSIGSGAFSGCSSLESMSIPFVGQTKDGSGATHFGYLFGASSYSNNSNYVPASLKTVVISGRSIIGDRAFYNCGSLTSVTIQNGVTSIGASAFYNCSGLTSITIPSCATSIGGGAFSGCIGLTSITIPSGATSIGSGAFRNCSGLTSVTIPLSVTSIEYAAFFGCSSLESMSIPFAGSSKTATRESALFGYIFGRSEYEGGTALKQFYYDGDGRERNTTYYIPSALRRVTVIGGDIQSNAFSNCSMLSSVSIAAGVTSIDHYAFRGCSGLTSITIPDSVTRIGGGAFFNCSALESITIPFVGEKKDGNANNWFFGYIFGAPFPNTGYVPASLKTVVISGGGISSGAFEGCSSLTSITIPSSVTSIWGSTFKGCSSLTSITIPSSVTSIRSSAFEGCNSLTSIYYEGDFAGWCAISGLMYLMNYGSSSKTLYINGTKVEGEYEIPDGVTSIGGYAFCNCIALTSVAIPSSVTSIGASAFYNCSGLTSITIPENVTSIGSKAFDGCSGLTSVTFENTSGWIYVDSDTPTSGIDVTDAETNASNLTEDYNDYYWVRNA